MIDHHKQGAVGRILGGIGPAIIVACVVLGPGSILTSSKVGCQFGFSLAWVLIAAGLLMLFAIITSAHVGVHFKDTALTEVSRRLGRPIAMLVGVSVFLIATCFQFSNNLGLLTGLETLIPLSTASKAVVLVAGNFLLCLCLFSLKGIYQLIERSMMVLMGIMLCGFAANLFFASISPAELAKGMIPSFPGELSSNFLPTVDDQATTKGSVVLIDPWLAVQGLIATSFSVAGAFYQSFLVKEKGLRPSQLKSLHIDSLVGTAMLILITLMIMATASSVLRGQVSPDQLKSAGDVAGQLEPLFGPAAKWLFGIGILAGAISSFLVNSMIGGTFLADGLGKNASLESVWTRGFTIGILGLGMLVALFTDAAARVPLIIFAQALTVLGLPVVSAVLIFLGTRKTASGKTVVPAWVTAINVVGFLVVILLATRTMLRIYLQFQAG